MAEYDNSGVLFRNDRKQNDRHPDYKGNMTIEGVEYWLSAWIKRGKKGNFMSLAVNRKETQGERDEAPPASDEPF